MTLLTAMAVAGPLGLPDSARPGAVRPEDVGKPVVPEAPPAAAVMEIPQVIDRPLEIDEGPRVVVDKFRLLDARDLPEFDITLADVESLLEEQRKTHPEGFTIGNMQEVADEVTRFYRDKGLILAQVVVPVQTVQSAVVDLQVFEGKLGRVLAEGNANYSDAILKGPFKNLLGKPVTKDEIESALLELTDLPGLTVFGVFQPGQLVGTADIVLRVQEEDRFDFSLRADNHGLQETGRARFRPSIEWNNVLGWADKLTLTVQQTYNPKNNDFKSFEYEKYLGWGMKWGGFINRNKFNVGGELAAQQIFGKTEQNGLWLSKAWVRSRQFNLSSRLGLTMKESDQFVRRRQNNRDRLTVASLEFTLDHVDTRFKGINFATVEYSRGFNDVFGAMGSPADNALLPAGVRPSRQGGSGRLAAGMFDKVYATASRLQSITSEMQFLLRTEFQWSSDLLVSTEQYSMGGPDNLRAFPQAQQLFDRGLFLSAELIHNMPFIGNVNAFGNRTWGELVQFSAFYEYFVGRLNDPLDSEDPAYQNFKGAGIQARFTLPGKIESRLMWAWEVDSDVAANGRSPQVWGDLTYRF